MKRCIVAALLAGLLGMAAADDSERLLEAARAAGRVDRNADAARLYGQALAQAPGRRRDIVPPLAWQLLWSEQAAAAEALFAEWLAFAVAPTVRAEALDGLAQSRQAQNRQREALAAFEQALALDPQNARLRRRVATSLLWNDRHPEAIAQLRELQIQAPQERELGWMLANAYNFAGRHRDALAEFRRWGDPRNGGERIDLARAYYWAGEADAALPLLADAGDAAGRQLRDYHARRETQAFGYATLDHSEDRDGLRARAALLGFGLPAARGATLELNLRQLQLRADGQERRGEQLELSYRVRLGSSAHPAGTAWVSAALRQAHHGDWSPLSGTVRLRWLPRDLWRLDAEVGRELVETPLALNERVEVDVLSLSAEHRPDVRWTWAAAATGQHFDDGTTRLRLNLRAETALQMRPRWRVGVEGGVLQRQSSPSGGPADRGYWNPRRYAEARAYSSWVHEVPGHEFQARVGWGRSREWGEAAGQASSGSPHLWEFGWAVDPSPRWRARLALGGAGQGFGVAGGGAGYWRRYVNLSVNVYGF